MGLEPPDPESRVRVPPVSGHFFSFPLFTHIAMESTSLPQ